MNEIYQLLSARNSLETTPFVSIHETCGTLLNQVGSLEKKCSEYEREISRLQREFQDTTSDTSSGGGNVNSAASAALKNEARLRDKLEKVQEEFNAKLKVESEDRAATLKLTKELSELKDLTLDHEQTINDLKIENEKRQKAIEHLSGEVENAQSDRRLAEQQYEGLKSTIRVLQEENDKLQKENRELETRVVTEKTKMLDEINKLAGIADASKKEVEMLRSYQKQDTKQKSWFGSVLGGISTQTTTTTAKTEETVDATRKWGDFDVVLPSCEKETIKAHKMEGTRVRYDASGNSSLIATSSHDSTVKIWDVATGKLRSTLRGTNGHPMLTCDIDGKLAIGAGSDKTCRVWQLRTERMLHHLVGHQHKITCARLIGGNTTSVVTGSADRSIKIWDISRTTYKQTTTLRHGSTSQCLDVGSDFSTIISGHMDGGLRFWDLRTGNRTMDISDMHQAGVTSVHWNPSNNLQVLTNGLDSCLRLVDIRTGQAIHTFQHEQFHTSQSWSSSVLSPNGQFAAAGCNRSGSIFVWDTSNGSLAAQLDGHAAGVCGIDWGRGGGQQVASLDRSGSLILWA